MIYGVGVDMVAIARIERSIARPGFMEYTYTEEERTRFAGQPRRLAGNFAAKEALSKALGTGVRGFSLRDMAVLRDELGAPYFVFSGALADILNEKGLTAHVGLTNTEDTATAFVVLETREETR